jgi:hypothetical protein
MIFFYDWTPTTKSITIGQLKSLIGFYRQRAAAVIQYYLNNLPAKLIWLGPSNLLLSDLRGIPGSTTAHLQTKEIADAPGLRTWGPKAK